MAATRALIDAIGRGWDEDPDVRPEISEIATALEGIVGRCDSEMGGGGDRDGRIGRDRLGRCDPPLPERRGRDPLDDMMMGRDAVVDAGAGGSVGDGVHRAELR